MKRKQGSTVVGLMVVVFVLYFASAWVWNAVKLASCDFEPGYSCEVWHTAGLVVPPLSMVAVWVDDDGERHDN
jgi:hypothetical protein